MYLSTIEWLMCVSELNFFFPLSCGVEQKKNRWESGGRPNGRRCVSFTRPAGLVVCRRESLRRRRRRSASIDDIEQFVSIAAGDGAHRHLIRFGGVGQDGSADVQRRRRTQVPVQDVPTGRPNPNYIDIIHSLFSFFFHFVLISSGWPCFGYHLLGSNTRCMSRQIERNSEKKETPPFLLPSTHEQLCPLSGEIKQQRDWSIRLINKKFFCSPSGRRKDNSSACACHTRAPCPSRAAGSKHFSIF